MNPRDMVFVPFCPTFIYETVAFRCEHAKPGMSGDASGGNFNIDQQQHLRLESGHILCWHTAIAVRQLPAVPLTPA